MKKFLMLTLALSLLASGASAAILASDDFSYADGLLVPQGGWTYHSGNDDFLIASGQAVVTHGTPSGDVNLAVSASGTIYYSLDFSVDDPGAPLAGTDFEYFAHFLPDGGYGFCARLDVQSPTGAGDFTVGISTVSSTAEATWASDLTYGVMYHAVVSYDQDDAIAKLWIDGSLYTDLYIMGDDLDDLDAETVTGFALRQSDSSENETVRVDNLIVADSCEDVFAGGCPSVANEASNWGAVKSLYR